MRDPAEAVDGSGQNPEEDEPAGVIEEDGALLVAWEVMCQSAPGNPGS